MGILIELVVEAVAWVLFELLGEVVGDLFGRRRRRERAAAAALSATAPPTTWPEQAPEPGTAHLGGAPPGGPVPGVGVPGAADPGAAGTWPTAEPVPVPAAATLDLSGSGPSVSVGCSTWLMAPVMVAIMGAVGFWWGDRRFDVDADDVPTTLYVGLGLAAACFVLTIVQVLRRRAASEVVGPPLQATALGGGWKGALLPWHWAPSRLVIFGLANLALAAGVAVGFS